MRKYEGISCHHFVEKNGYVYFSNWLYNGLFCVELKTGRTVFLGTFMNEEPDEVNIHCELLLIKDFIYFFPRRGRHIHVYSLIDKTISAIEVRKDSETFFWIVEVLVEGMNAFLLPMDERMPIKCCDLNSWTVRDIINREDIPEGVCLSKSWASFPNMILLEKYQIEKADKFSWMQMPDEKWCAFLPMGRQILWYTPGTQEIEAVPLEVINEAELDAYLQPLRYGCLRRGQVFENHMLTFREYLKAIVLQTENENAQYKSRSGLLIGDSIWKYVKG